MAQARERQGPVAAPPPPPHDTPGGSDGAAAAPAPGAVPLDQVMLAMDVVDTLRHQQSIVDEALNDDERRQALIARVRAIYESQGIDVPEHVVAEGVAALEQDRFVYTPPERTFAVRLAELYVDRAKWAKRALIAGGALLVLGLAVWVPMHLHENAQIAAFERRQAAVARQGRDLEADIGELRREVQAARAGATPPAAATVIGATLDDADRTLDAAKADLEAARPQDLARVDAADYPEQQERLDQLAALHQRALEQVAARLGVVRGQLRTVATLRGMDAEIERTLARLAAVDVEPGARADLTALAERTRAALAGGDAEAAQRHLQQLQDLVALLEQSYELRIVSRPGVQSGVWRVAPGGGRSYYLIVEARDAHGQPVKLPIESAEQQRVRRVSTFGVRVPPEVYERVRADKAADGIVDDTLAGTKAKGARGITWRLQTLGGYITEW